MTAPWATLEEVPSAPALPGTPEEQAAEWDAILAQASEVLFALSGRRWSGERTVTYEVVAPAAGTDLPPAWWAGGGWPMHPALEQGQIVNHSCCPAPVLLRLPGSPREVLSVTHRGALRDPASYVLSGPYLEDRSRRGWPVCDPGVIVTYKAGRTPPAGGRRAAALLARELARSRLGDPACALPANVTSQTRQGISQTFVSAADLIALGQTGVVPVDSWLATVNPARLTRPARAWSPDTATRTYRRTP